MRARIHIQRTAWPVAALLLILGLSVLACNFPYLAGQGEQLEAEIAGELERAFGRPIQEVRLSGDVLELVYALPLVQAQETTLAEVTLLLQTGAVQASRVDQVRVLVECQGVPTLAITTRARDARLLAEGELAPEAFLANLEIKDLRPVDQVLRQALASLGYDMRSASYVDGVLELSFWQPEADAPQELVRSWLPVWQLAALHAPQASQVVLHAGLLGQPDLRVAAPMPLLKDFQAGRLSPAEFLLGLEVQDE